jgi:hypothetical protein
MNLTKLGKILDEVSDSIQSNRSQWNFKIKDVFFICIADSIHNRMRIISPISDSDMLDEKLKESALIANFHTALDIKYAISDNILWAVFIHPLKELTQQQVIDAISQTYYGNINFGTTFSSTSLVFPGRKSPKKEVEEKHSTKKI